MFASVPLTRFARTLQKLLVAMLLCLLLASCGAVGLQQVSAAMYGRADTNRTQVYSPRVRGRAGLGEDTSVDVAVALDAWSGASVDVVASASQPVTEVRREVNTAVSHTMSLESLLITKTLSPPPQWAAPVS